MPVYTLEDDKGKQHTLECSFEEYEQFLADNPQYSRVWKPVALGDPIRLGIRKQDGAFNEVLQKAKKAHPRGTINTGNITQV